jgi:FkbH-like protein
LNIGIDSLALLDDSDFERRQVRDALPCVRCYRETEIPALLTYPEIDTLVTEESRNRRLMYRAEELRGRMMREENADTISFLRKCNLRMRIFTPQTEEELLRCFELVNRTNQLNMSGRKYTRESFNEMLGRPEHRNFAFSCEDDFGAYGIVGFGQYRIEERKLLFSEFAMSCRVAGKYVESALFSCLLSSEGCSAGEMPVIKTKKNSLLRRTLTEIGFSVCEETGDSICFRFTAELKNRELVKAEWKV